ncbi:hypothetical protein [Streptomyces sp. TR06-5]|uniref:hypothetical protein n=1 Tax=unclassified Streptomyces TaxID=2593676 RepID=UPI0039A14A98
MRRHRFEPARFLLGLLLCGAGLAHLLDASGAVQLRPLLLVTLVPAALAAAAVTALLTRAVRRAAPREATGTRPGAEDDRW